MTDKRRYRGRIEGETFYITGEDDRIEVGSIEAIVDLIGGETYTLEYTPRQSAVSWLATDDDDTITIDVRWELADWVYTDEFVRNVEQCSLERTGEHGYPVRTEVFADLVTDI